jgi:hypothetical protein
MKKITTLVITATMALLLSSCSMTMPVAVSDAEIGQLRGESNTFVFLGIYLNPDYGIKDAATNGNITSAVATVDEKVTNFIIFQTRQLIVTAK